MNQTLKINNTNPLLLASTTDGPVKPEPAIESAEKSKSKGKAVNNIHSQIFKEFRRLLYTPTVYNKDEINMLIADQQNMTDREDKKMI